MKVKWFGWTVFALLMLTWSATATTAAAQDSRDWESLWTSRDRLNATRSSRSSITSLARSTTVS